MFIDILKIRSFGLNTFKLLMSDFFKVHKFFRVNLVGSLTST